MSASLSQINNYSTFGCCPKFRNLVFVKIFKIHELWTANKCAETVTLTKVRGALKTSWQALLNCVKPKIPTVLYYRPKVHEFFQFLCEPKVQKCIESC